MCDQPTNEGTTVSPHSVRSRSTHTGEATMEVGPPSAEMQISTTSLCLKHLILIKLFLYLTNWPESCWATKGADQPLRSVDYSDLKTIKALMTQAELLTSPLSAAKNLDGGPVPGRVITRELQGGWARLVGWGSYEGKLPPSVSAGQENICLSSICAPIFL